MALIKCPECGEQVSSSATQCVHCGCTYTVCPECGKIHIGEFEVCPECGFQIKNKRTPFQPNVKNSTRDNSFGTDVVDIWQKRSSTDKIVMKTLKIAYIALYSLCLLFLIIGIIVIETWDPDGVLKDILTGNISSLGGIGSAVTQIYDNAHGLIAAASITFALAPIVKETSFLYSQVMCGAWLRKKNIDVVPYVKKLDGQLEFNNLPKEWDYDNFCAAAYLSVVPHDKNIKIAKYVFNAVCVAIIAICGGVFITQIFDELIKLQANKDYSFVFYFDALVSGIVFAIIYFVGNVIFEKMFNNRKELWLQSL